MTFETDLRTYHNVDKQSCSEQISFLCNNLSTNYDNYDGENFSDCPTRQNWTTNDDLYV
jgi:hypothetical protein